MSVEEIRDSRPEYSIRESGNYSAVRLNFTQRRTILQTFHEHNHEHKADKARETDLVSGKGSMNADSIELIRRVVPRENGSPGSLERIMMRLNVLRVYISQVPGSKRI